MPPLWRDATRSSERMRRLRAAKSGGSPLRRARSGSDSSDAQATRGIGEALAVMLSVVVFGLGVMTLVARNEVTLAQASSGPGTSYGGEHAAPARAVALPGHTVSR